ncbi:MAG: pantoate kinase [Thermoplasmatota archaeon]
MVLRGVGFCPGHITGFFSIHDRGKEILARGSRGAGVNLSLGAISSITLRSPDRTGDEGPLKFKLAVKGVNEFKVDPRIYGSVVEALLPERGKGWEASVRVTLQLPVGQGFGMSGAGALSISIALWEAFYSEVPAWDRKLRFKAQQERFFSVRTDRFKVKPMRRRLVDRTQLWDLGKEKVRPVRSSGKASGMLEEGGGVRSPKRWLDDSQAESDMGMIGYSDIVEAAHRADILTRGGLGDVVAQARGGIEMRLAPGVPPFGEVHTIPVNIESPPSVAIMTVDEPIETSTVLSNKLKRKLINEAGETALSNLLKDPTPERMMEESSQFSRLSRLQSLKVKGALMEVEKFTHAAQIMVGNSVFAFVGGHFGLDRRKAVVNTWKKRGEVKICEIDLIGARPLN